MFSAPRRIIPAPMRETPSQYLQRVMDEADLSAHEVALRAREHGHDFTVEKVDAILEDNALITKLRPVVQSLAAGLGRPEAEVFQVFRKLR